MFGKSISIFEGKREERNIKFFALSHIENIMYFYHKLDVCGVTGTGKTTTIRTAIERL